MTKEDIARIAHNINRAYAMCADGLTPPTWDNAPDWQKESVLAGVALHVANPAASASESHEAWYAHKAADGWTYGEIKDSEAKTHPCMVPFEELPLAQQAKDFIFREVVHQLAPLLDEN